MNSKNTSNRKQVPWRTILLTVLVTIPTVLAAAYFTGYLHPASLTPVKAATGQNAEPTLYTCGMHPWIITEEPGLCPICNMTLTPKRDTPSADSVATGEREILYWRAPMNPNEIYDKPGKSAMGMDLVPVYEDEVIGGVSITIDPVTRQNMGLRTARVMHGPLTHTIRTYGHITYDETRQARISPKFSGWIEKLHVDFTGQSVRKGQLLFEIYSPELVTAQEEYLAAFRVPRGRAVNHAMLDSVHRRLEFYDISKREITALEKSGKVRRTLTIRSPFKGVVTHKNAVEGGYVKAGETIYQIVDLSRVWVEAHIYEYELSRVKPGLKAEMTLPYLPGEKFSGTVAYIYPYMQRQTRDVVIRLEFANPDGVLKPDMYADIHVHTQTGEGLIIPSEAIIRSGERNLVFVSRGKGKFTPREVRLGITVDGGKTHILSGLAPDEEIVTSGQFLLDSESKLKEAVQKMLEAKTGGKPQETHGDDFFDDMETDEDFFDDMDG